MAKNSIQRKKFTDIASPEAIARVHAIIERKYADSTMPRYARALQSVNDVVKVKPKDRFFYSKALTNVILFILKNTEGVAKAKENVNKGMYIKGKVVQDVIGRSRELPGQWIPGKSLIIGEADLSFVYRGRSVDVEVKIGNDSQSDAQRQYQADIERAGGIYWIVRNLDQFLELYDNLILQQ